MPTRRWRGIVGLTLVAAASGCRDPTLRKANPYPYLLVEKGQYQSLYDDAGRIERLVYDSNGDRTADTLVLYGPDGQVRQAEIDTDLDRVIDRWEYFDNGALVRLGYTRRRPGVPDYWEKLAADGTPTGREYDDDGDGRVDRSEPMD